MTGSRISVIIPVLHESGIINETIDHIRTLEGGKKVEIIVVDGGEELDTLRSIADPLVIKVPSEKGRGEQMDNGARVATGEILIFLHADTELPPHGLQLVKDTLDDSVICAGAFTLSFNDAPFFLRITLFLNDIRGRLTRIPYGDQSLFMKERTYRRIGGYKNYRIMEDVDLMIRMKKAGMKIRILKEKVRTSPRRFRSKGILKTLLENILLLIQFHFGADPEKLARRYYNDG